jgi:HEAT repeat protein
MPSEAAPLDLRIAALLSAGLFEEAETEAETATSTTPEHQRARRLLDLANGAEPLSLYRDYLRGAAPSLNDRVLLAEVARGRLERLLHDVVPFLARYRAIRWLGELRAARALSSLARILSNEDVTPGVLLLRRAAAEALAAIGGRSAREAAEPFLQDEDPGVRRGVLSCMASAPEDNDLHWISRSLRLGSTSERAGIATAIAKARYPNARALLTSLLRDPAESVCLAAARAIAQLGKGAVEVQSMARAFPANPDPKTARLLGYLGGEGALEALLYVLRGGEEGVAAASALALGDLGDRSAAEALAEVAQSPQTLLAVAAIEALELLGDGRVLSQLVPLLWEDDRRLAVVKALGRIGGPGVQPILLDLLVFARGPQGDWRLLRGVVEALGSLGDSAAVPVLLSLLQGHEQRVHAAAAQALGRIGDPVATSALLRALRDGDGDVREHAAHALCDIGDPAALPTLLALADDPNPERQAAAAFVLGTFAQLDLPSF